jgi:hypothetical protein
VSQHVVTSPDDLDEERQRVRRLPEMAIGIALIVAGGIGSVLLYQSASDTETIVGVARSLRRGHILQRTDLTGIEVPGEVGTVFVGADEAMSLVGKVILIDITSGTPLTANMFTNQAVLESGDVLTAVALRPGQFPPGLAVGDRVSVALLPDVTVAQATPPLIFDGEVSVWSIKQPDGDFAEAIVTLRSNLDFSRLVAAASSTRLSLIGEFGQEVAP